MGLKRAVMHVEKSDAGNCLRLTTALARSDRPLAGLLLGDGFAQVGRFGEVRGVELAAVLAGNGPAGSVGAIHRHQMRLVELGGVRDKAHHRTEQNC